MRDRLVQTRLTDAGFDTVDTRSAQAGLAMGAWLALIGEDVAHGRPALTGEQLQQLADAAERLARIGKSLNLLAVGENVGRAVPEAQITATLVRLDRDVAAAMTVLDDVAGSTPRPRRRSERVAAGSAAAAAPRSPPTPTSAASGSSSPASASASTRS